MGSRTLLLSTLLLSLIAAPIRSAEASPHAQSARGVASDARSLEADLAMVDAPAAIAVVDRRGGLRTAAKGLADPTRGRAFTAATPLRVASNTKTFVAATVLRLWEQERINLDAPIGPLIAPELDTLLRGDGYNTGRITVRHLLSHSAGLYDHGGDPRYLQAVLADPRHVWTKAEQIGLLVDYADPQSAPGTEFRHSDDGYILLGDIVERITGQDLAAAVRRELRLDRLGLKETWWERKEQPPRSASTRARQFIGKLDATDIDASMDLYGGGGLVMSPRDLARFFAALFDGKIFDRPATLREMMWKGSHKGADAYRLGIFVKPVNGRELYWHSGFWGTAAYYDPSTGRSAAGATLNQAEYRKLIPVLERAVAP
jgi:D-alanyl-D-alanine carboxypeptidase